MEKTAVRFFLLIKRSVKNGTVLSAVILMVLFTILFAAVRPPERESTRVLLYGSDPAAKELIRELETSDSAFTFEEAPDPAALTEAVRSSAAECGFLFDEEFGKKLESGNTDEIIVFAASPFTVKGNAAKETVFAALLKRWSALLLERESETIFREPEEALPLVREKADLYAQSEFIFSLDYREIDGTGREPEGTPSPGEASSARGSTGRKTLPVHSLTALFLFLLCLFDQEENKFTFVRIPLFRGSFFFLKNLAVLLVPALTAFLLNRILEPRVSLGADLLLTALFVLLCPLWARLFGLFFRRQEGYLCLMIFVLLFSLVVTPVFWNPAEFFPPAAKAAWLLPNGLYAALLSLTG